MAYWVGYLGVGPLACVVIAAVRNALTPKGTNGDTATSGGLTNFLWPTRPKPEPRVGARFGRVLHWFFVAGALAFVTGGAYAITYTNDANSGLAMIFFGGGVCFLIGRALRYILAGE